MDITQQIEEQLPEGYSVYRKAARAGVIGGARWIITAPGGMQESIDSAALTAYAVSKLQQRIAGAAQAAALPVEAPATSALQTQPTTRRCEHTDTDNNGICYSCGAYVRGADAGRVIRRYGIAY